MKELMPSPNAILGAKLFKAPLFPIALLRDIAKLYNFGDIPDVLRLVLSLTPLEANNRFIMTYIWFADLLDLDIEAIKSAIAAYHRNGCSSLSFGEQGSADRVSSPMEPGQ